jgi:murein DD-endopeptidase MepM/ murein hydrolase activator NlpD
MRRLVLGTTLLALVAVAPAAHADPPKKSAHYRDVRPDRLQGSGGFGSARTSLTDAHAREQALRAELQQATRELQDTEAGLAEAEDRLAFDRQRVQVARRQLATTRTAVAGQVAAMYRSGGLLVASALLERDPEGVPDRIELATVLVSRQAQTIEDAQVAETSYQTTLQRVAEAYQRAKALRDQAGRAVQRLKASLDRAQALQTRLAKLEQRQASAAPAAPASPAAPARGGIACILARPYSYVDTWGAARSGGRTHQGTDVMAPYGAQVYAYTAGVVSRESTSSNGGLQLYLQGDNGVEYFYAHLSRYAVPAGTRVRVGQLVAYNGQSGNARYAAPHVHFEVHPGGPGSAPVNPYPYVQRACP